MRTEAYINFVECGDVALWRSFAAKREMDGEAVSRAFLKSPIHDSPSTLLCPKPTLF